ncbi:MAG: sulfite exporter TauE/SafE family protein [Pseudomonadota bacterium]
MITAGYLSLFFVGLLGGTHCVGMCGGIVGALSLNTAGAAPRIAYQLAYNGGRIASYTVLGALAGAVGAGGLLAGGVLPVQQVLFVVANLMLIALGLSMAGWWQGVAVLERGGRALWTRMQPLAARVLPVRTLPGAFVAGTVWGWLPCGLVYSVLFTALMSGDALTGALIMLAFGLGTLPNLVAMGWFASGLRGFLQQPWVRIAAALLVIGFGAIGLLRLSSIPLGIGGFCATP